MSEASSLDMKEAVDTANETEQKELLQPDGEDKNKKKTTPGWYLNETCSFGWFLNQNLIITSQ